MKRLATIALLATLPLQAAALTIIVPMPPSDFPPVKPPVTRDAP